ncbi:Cytoskeleton protein RodZ [Vibrio aerogenes CECT 7868]|uniref:Cytoskeleton protein RodZ n=1 Tax=Vibrio aerogenes CECT 7868 TaxID=1216006 RepID=A0A1M5YX70_9VIBR|nr:cytoskeleton protein RodZ [Vibrio aerogenes]SHI16649.1 Cytoskeleton protein RodZ [Vibrio aerogenes CECT 7868]
MMTETETETTKDETPQKPGTLLKQKRESLGLTQKQVADKLRLRVTVIESLEDNNFNIDKVSTFVRGYIRSYARIVGLDEQSVVAAYDQYCGSEKQEVSMTSFSRKTARQQHNSRINLITFGIIVIVIGISSLWWYQNQKDDTLLPQSISPQSDSQTETSTSEPSEASTLVTEKPAEDEFNTVKALSSQDSKEENALSVDSAEVDHPVAGSKEPPHESPSAVVEKTAPAEAGVASSRDTEKKLADTKKAEKKENNKPVNHLTQLSMEFKDDCWVRVKDSNDKTLIVGLKKAGRSIQLQGNAPFSFILGAPESVSITFAGEPVDLSRYTSGKVARFTLP